MKTEKNKAGEQKQLGQFQEYENPVQCDDCKDFHDVPIPQHMIEALYKGNVVIFAGAGVSTENSRVFPYTFYDDVKGELGIPPDLEVSFPKLITRYCAQPDGRAKLLRKIQERMDYIRSFPSLYRAATHFHVELSTVHQIETIVTTNWDNYFEHECGAIPFVTPQDFALWNTPGRKVFKIHGSIANYGSIVATEEDYKMCYKNLRDGILGSTLKHLLGTKTIIYVGYSFRDEDFRRIHQLLRREMGTLLPYSYIVTLDANGASRFRQLDLTPIYTDATYFLHILKRRIVADGQMLDDARLMGVNQLLDTTLAEHWRLHKKLDPLKHPEMIYAASYQDGVIHACERILALKDTGYYAHICNVRNAIGAYDRFRREKLRARRYFDVAYIDGFVNGLIYLIVDDESRDTIPLYYIFGVKEQPQTFAEYSRLRKKAAQLHKSAYSRAKKQTEAKPGLQLHHTPFLL